MDLGKDLVAASATPLVLAILAEGDSYGYAIIKRVNELSGGHLQWTDGMLYPVLHGSNARATSQQNGAHPTAADDESTTASPRRVALSSKPQRKQWQVVDDTLRGVWLKAQMA